jgi:hypothetical protein
MFGLWRSNYGSFYGDYTFTYFDYLHLKILHSLQKTRYLEGVLSHLAGVLNLRGTLCGSFENCRLMDSHKLTTGVLRYRWYQA